MNDKKMACVLLLILIGGMVYGTQQMRAKANAAKDASMQAEQTAQANEQNLSIAEINLKSIQTKTAELRDTYEKWRPHLQGYATTQEAEARITELVRESGVFLISQRFDTRQLEKAESIPTAVKGSLVFEDDFTKTMNFLGKLEQKLPALRVTNCRLIRGDRANNINLELTVELPIIDLPAPPASARPPATAEATAAKGPLPPNLIAKS